VRKCGYCDFYSVSPNADLLSRYKNALLREIANFSDGGVSAKSGVADTLYFGGGTPSLFGEYLAEVTAAVRGRFCLPENAEITLEANPGVNLNPVFEAAASAGVNRVSVGVQSAHPGELDFLSRAHSRNGAQAAVLAARASGIHNLSADVMLGIPGQTEETLRQTLDFCLGLDICHLSAYILKAEPSTPLYARRHSLPSGDETAELYLFACEYLECRGLNQYEISNFARPGSECRHNLKYWRCREYIGFGPAAHSFFAGERFNNIPSLDAYFSGAPRRSDGVCGGFEEFTVLALRLTRGLCKTECERRFPDGGERFERLARKAEPLAETGLVVLEEGRIALTPRGFLVQNAVLGRLL
jgi:oxygen-independent coproporphyrinogen-3 oxidase